MIQRIPSVQYFLCSSLHKKNPKKTVAARCLTVVILRGKTASQKREAGRYAGDLYILKLADSCEIHSRAFN